MPTSPPEPSTSRRIASKLRDLSTRTHPVVSIAVVAITLYLLVRFGAAFAYDVVLSAFGVDRDALGAMQIVVIPLLFLFGMIVSLVVVLALGLASVIVSDRRRARRTPERDERGS